MPLFSRLFLAFCAVTLLATCGDSGKSVKTPTVAAREDILLRIAHVTESGGDLAAAERMYVQAVSASPHSTEAPLELAEFYRRHNESGKAIASLEEAVQAQPKNTDLMRALANAYINKNSPDKALATLNNAIAIDGKNALLFSSRGVALDMLGDYAEAQKSYQTALLLAPQDAVTIKTNLSMSYILSGSYDEAVALLLPLLSSPDVTAHVRQNLALAYGLEGDSAKARKLGLEDVSPQQMEQNLAFYRVAAKRNAAAPVGRHPDPERSEGEESRETLPLLSPAAASPNPTAISLPVPVLKPDRAE